MNISQFLLTNALDTIWSNPQGDDNVVVKTNKLTTNVGAVGTVYLPFGNIQLPPTGRLYMLVELGAIPANDLGIQTTPFNWTPLRTISTTYNTLILGFSRGRLFSLENSYILFDTNGNVLIAIDYSTNASVLGLEDDIYFRFYTNIFYNGNVPTTVQQLKTGTYINSISTQTDYIGFVATVNSLISESTVGPLIFKNGIYLPAGMPSYTTLLNNDIFDYIYDPFMVDLTTFNLQDMPSFQSTLDSSNKLIASLDTEANNVYVADMEFYITGVNSSGIRVGAYYPRLNPNYVRMLTYKDWSIDSALINARLNELENYPDINQTLTNVQVYVFRRNNNQIDAAILDSNYIPDLMNLPTTVRKQAISGINSTLPIWQAANLEGCPYNTWISTNTGYVDTVSLYGVYSRYAAIAAIERVRLLPGNTNWSLPANSGSSGGYLLTYGADGFGINMINYTAGNDLSQVTYTNGLGVETFYPALGATDPLDIIVWGGVTTPTAVTPGYGVFCYYMKNSVLTYAVYNVDYTITETPTNTTITWSSNIQQYERFVRTANTYIYFTSSFTHTDFENGIDIYGGREKVNDVGMGVLAVWLNGGYLIEGLDYTVYNGKAYLVSRPFYWTDPATITIIYAGLPDSSLQHVPQTNWGWVKYGKILNDGKYDLLMYRNKSIYINGAIIPLNEVSEKELYVDETNVAPPAPYIDGSPYAIVNTVQYTSNSDLDTLTPTDVAEKIQDNAVSAYLSTLYPQPINNGIVVIPQKYQLVSPLMDILIKEILNGTITIIDGMSYTNDVILSMVAPYMYLLNVDPSVLNMDLNFVDINPTWSVGTTDVSIAQYGFLAHVNTLILNNNVVGMNLYLNVV